MDPHASVAAGMASDRGTERPMDDGGGARTLLGPHHARPQGAKGHGVRMSPAAEEGRASRSDRALLRSVTAHLAQFADTIVGPNAGGFLQDGGAGVALVETAGGGCSPLPDRSSATPDRPMRLPCSSGDVGTGGISTTITAFDVLTMRGYDVVAILVPDGGYGNTDAIRAYAEPRGAPAARACRCDPRQIARRAAR